MSLESIYEDARIEQYYHDKNLIESISDEELKILEREAFEGSCSTDKDSLVEKIDDAIATCMNSVNPRSSITYLKRYKEFLEKFRDTVKGLHLMDCDKSDYWCYSFEIFESGINLYLEYQDPSFDKEVEGEMVVVYYSGCTVLEQFTLLKVTTKMMTIDEFAEFHDVPSNTVRQWIRRAKIKCAVKTGNEWRIPELCDINYKGYKPGNYSWKGELQNVPKEFSFLQGCQRVFIFQDDKNKLNYNVILSKHGDSLFKKDNTKIVMNIKEREAFEFYLISEPSVNVSISSLDSY